MTNHHPASIILTDSEGLTRNTEPAILVLQIDRNDIETCNMASTLEKLHIISDTRENALLYQESLVLQVSGYDSDKRELPEIPEVRRFFAKLSREWPHWMWFLCRDVGAIALFLATLCEIRIHRNHFGFYTEFKDQEEVARCIGDLFERGNVMFHAYGVTPQQAEKSAKSAIEELM